MIKLKNCLVNGILRKTKYLKGIEFLLNLRYDREIRTYVCVKTEKVSEDTYGKECAKCPRVGIHSFLRLKKR